MIKKDRKIIAVLLVIVIFISVPLGCSKKKDDEVSTTTTTTTTTTTRPTTTEDLDTTFAEDKTQKVYKGLYKDPKGSYPYKLATYSSSYDSSNTSRTANLSAAAKKINNVSIPENGIFSFNQTVGKRTVTAGYSTAKIIQDRDFVDGLGGGVCQVSSTVFQCVLRANAEIVYRTNHTLKISYVPLGGDATVQWNSTDFKFKNTTGTKIRLNMRCEEGKLICEVFGKEDVNVGNVEINISKSGEDYVLTRTVNGSVNYRTRSHYQQQKTTAPPTTKAPSTKKDTKAKTTKKA